MRMKKMFELSPEVTIVNRLLEIATKVTKPKTNEVAETIGLALFAAPDHIRSMIADAWIAGFISGFIVGSCGEEDTMRQTYDVLSDTILSDTLGVPQ